MLALVFVDQWEPSLQQAVESVFAALCDHLNDLPTGAINLKLVDDATSAKLNAAYSGNDYSTDVLTFNYIEDDPETAATGELADIVISSDTATRQATESGTDLADEVALLALHGILHVLGYDHAEKDARSRVDEIQAELMQSAGLTYRNFAWVE